MHGVWRQVWLSRNPGCHVKNQAARSIIIIREKRASGRKLHLSEGNVQEGEARRTWISLWVPAPGRCQEMLGKAWTHSVDREVPKSVLTCAGRAKRAWSYQPSLPPRSSPHWGRTLLCPLSPPLIPLLGGLEEERALPPFSACPAPSQTQQQILQWASQGLSDTSSNLSQFLWFLSSAAWAPSRAASK